MKKLVLALIVALTLAPLSAFGLEMLNDDTLKDTTAQAGVVIAVDDVVLVQHSQMTTWYIDEDGVDAQDTYGTGVDVQGAGLYIQDLGESKRTIRINAIYTGQSLTTGVTALDALGVDGHSFGTNMGVDVGYQYGLYRTVHEYDLADGFLVQQPLTIDIGKCPILSAGITAMKNKMLDLDLNGTPETLLINMVSQDGSTAGTLSWEEYQLGAYMNMSREDFQNPTLTDMVGINITLPTVEIDQTYTAHIKEIGVKLVGDLGSDHAQLDRGTASAASTYVNALAKDHLIRIKKSGRSTLAITCGKLEIAPK